MINTQEKIGREREFISLLLKNKDLVQEWMDSGPDIKYFDDIHHLLLEAIIYAYNNEVHLTRRTFLDFLRSYQISKIRISNYDHLYNIINSIPCNPNDFFVLKKQIIESYVSVAAIKSIELYTKNKEKGELYAARLLADDLSALVDDNQDKSNIYYGPIDEYSKEWYDKMLKKRSKEGPDDEIKCHIWDIDLVMGVGFPPGSLTLFTGDVGAFKSSMMLNVGANMWKLDNRNVLFVPLEMPREQVYQRLLSMQTQIPSDKLQHPHKLNEEDLEKINVFHKEIEEHEKRFYIMDAPSRISVGVIWREIERNINRFSPDAVIIDYIANLVPDKHTFRKDRNDLEIGDMLKSLRALGKPGGITDKGFAVVSGAQIGREALKRLRRSGINKAAFHSEDIRGSHEYSADSDFMFAQFPDPQQHNTRLHFYILKSRHSSPFFSNQSKKTILEVRPEINLITSMKCPTNDFDGKEIMAKVDNKDLDDFDDMDDDAKNDDVTNNELEELEENNVDYNSNFDKIMGIQ